MTRCCTTRPQWARSAAYSLPVSCTSHFYHQVYREGNIRKGRGGAELELEEEEDSEVEEDEDVEMEFGLGQ